MKKFKESGILTIISWICNSFPKKNLKDYSNFDFRRKFFATLSQLRSCFKIMFFLNLLKETPFCKRYDSGSFLRTLHFINIFRNSWLTSFLSFCNLHKEAIFASYFDQIWETLTLVKKIGISFSRCRSEKSTFLDDFLIGIWR